MDAAPPPAAEVAPAPELELAPDESVHTCILILYCREQRAALIQLAPWLGVGGGVQASQARAAFSIGFDATIAVAGFFRPPGSDWAELSLRLGPWAALETPLDRVRGEGGLALALRRERMEIWGNVGLRGGMGVDTRGAAYWVTVLSWGLYGEPLRHAPCWGACDPVPPESGPATFGLADGARFFVSLRRELAQPMNEWMLGVELQPAWLWPLTEGQGYKRWRRH